jgi:hypothetical protein
MDKVISKVESSIDIINSINEYYGEFYKILTDQKIAKEISEDISAITPNRDKLIKRLKVFNSTASAELNLAETVTLVFQTYQLIKEYEIVIEKIINQLNEWNVFMRPDIIISEISQTKLLGFSKESNQLVLLLTNFKRRYEDHDVDLLKVLSDFIFKKINYETLTANDLKSIQELFHKYTLSIDIYAILLQTIMDHNKSLITIILQIIEEDKSNLLSSYDSKYTTEKCKIKSVQNPSLRCFGLVPSDVSKPIEELFKDITQVKDETKNVEQYLQKIASVDNIGIIYIKKFTAHPLEFSIWKLTRINDAAKYISQNSYQQNAGLNKTTIERMKVINYAEEPAPSNKWKLSEYELFGDVKHAPLFFIIDSFNNKTFRLIKPWADNSARLAKVPRTHIIGFLTFLGVIPGSVKDRVSIYNEIMENKIFENMLLKQPIDVAELVSDVQAEMDAPRLKQELVNLLYKGIKIPKNWADLGFLIHNPDLFDSFVDNIVKLYPIHFKDGISNDRRVQFPFSETISTFLVELNNVKKTFSRALHDKYIRTPKDTQITAFRSNDNISIFINQLFKAAIDDVITNKSNVYSSLLMKNKILTIELNESDIEKSVIGGSVRRGNCNAICQKLRNSFMDRINDGPHHSDEMINE